MYCDTVYKKIKRKKATQHKNDFFPRQLALVWRRTLLWTEGDLEAASRKEKKKKKTEITS